MQFLKKTAGWHWPPASLNPRGQRHHYYNDKDVKMTSIGSSATLKPRILFLQRESWTWMEQEAENKFLMQTP